jgi:uncharacterized protein (TIGR03086 family)
VPTGPLSRAFAAARSVLANVKPDQLDDSTPCASWKVRQLINHMVVAPRWGVGAMRSGQPGADDTDFSSGDYLAAYDESISSTLAAFEEEGALEKMVPLPFGEVPGAFLRTMITTDQFAHGWDLARATSQSTDLDPELAAELLAEAAIPDQFRGPDGQAPFGPAREAPAGAGAADKLAAHLGREV